MITDEELLELETLLYIESVEKGSDNLLSFTESTFKKFHSSKFHKTYYNILDLFAKGIIKNLIVSAPPQHGKSEGSSRRLPAYIAGKRPDVKTALISYNATKAEKFGREIITIMREPIYKDIFPEVKYPDRGYTGAKANTNTNRESINSEGSMKFVGVGGPLTGDAVDLLLLDDLYKDWQDANSPIIQERVWDWYLSVAETRLHNDSQQLIVFTRWSENDLVAKLEDLGKVKEYTGGDIYAFLKNLKHDEFIKINFRALKEGEPTDFDERQEGEALYPEKHSKEKLLSARGKDADKFDCLYQGDPVSKEGLLYSEFKTYSTLPELKIVKNYTDTADTGADKLCSVVYGLPIDKVDNHCYVIDLIYTPEPMEVTEPLTADLILRNNVNLTNIESNNGGRGFARAVEKLVKAKKRNLEIKWFHQGGNKEARIYSNSASVTNTIVFPSDWAIRWPEFYKAITKYKKEFKANKFDDGPDTLTGIVETESKNDWFVV